MPGGRLIMPRVRMPRLTRRGGASRAASERTTATTPNEATKAGAGADPDSTTSATETAPTAANPAAGANPTAETKTPEPNLRERMEGLQGWMAEIERKQARLAYFGALGLILALGAAGAALYFGLTAHSDSATKNDLDDLSSRVNSLEDAVSKNSKDTQNAINASVAQLQQTISGLQKQQAQAAANISTLQSQVNALNKAPAAAPPAAGSTTTTPATPGGANNP